MKKVREIEREERKRKRHHGGVLCFKNLRYIIYVTYFLTMPSSLYGMIKGEYVNKKKELTYLNGFWVNLSLSFLGIFLFELKVKI